MYSKMLYNFILTNKLIKHDYQQFRLKPSFCKFYGQWNDRVSKKNQYRWVECRLKFFHTYCKVAINHLIIYRFLCFSDYITVHTTGVTGHQRLRTSLWHILLPLFCRGPFLCCLFFVFFLCTFLILNTVWYHQVFFRCILRRKTIFKSNLQTYAHTFRKYCKLHVIC